MILAVTVAVAGGIGAVLRYLVDGAVQRRLPSPFPLGTLIINVTGSLVLGLLTGLFWYHGLSDHWRLVLGTGFCGGLTTWSTASWETVRLVDDRYFGLAFAYTLGGLAVAIGAAAAGMAVAAAA
ncbi:MAG TPA: fluoride efflux transporter CrcB [Acidimicrobiales bacterium]|nr:fluoride efflux transporter CrcB [Acidimicrobiales bacterium]